MIAVQMVSVGKKWKEDVHIFLLFIADLKELLQYYIDTRLQNYKVKIIALKHRSGLIRARLSGARAADGDVLIFLDAHCEATIGWAEPLLARIEEERTAVLVPIIDVIEAKDFSYATNGNQSWGYCNK